MHISQKRTGSADHCKTYSCEYPLLVWERKPAREKANFEKPPLSPSARGFLVSEALPMSGSNVAECDSLCGVMKCTGPCKTHVSQSYVPGFWCKKLQKSYMLWKFKRESWMRLGQHKLFVVMIAQQRLSLVSCWNVTKSDSHVTGEGYWRTLSFPKHSSGWVLRSTCTSFKPAYHDRLSTKADAENPVVVYF